MKNKQIIKETNSYGELDSFTNVAILKDDILNCNININLLHTGFSKRSWLLSKPDLYKGNGRVRHETHIINQGPFQTIYYSSLQGIEIHESLNEIEGKGVGGKNHCEITVFKNDILSEDKPIEKYSFDTFNSKAVNGHQEFARHDAIKSFFLSCLSKNKSEKQRSNFLQHENSIKILSMAYQSIANKRCGLNPLIKKSIS